MYVVVVAVFVNVVVVVVSYQDLAIQNIGLEFHRSSCYLDDVSLGFTRLQSAHLINWLKCSFCFYLFLKLP